MSVVALTMFDLKKRGKVGSLGLCGTSGAKFPGIRAHMKQAIEDVYTGTCGYVLSYLFM
jgi:D-galacturonate reductase